MLKKKRIKFVNHSHISQSHLYSLLPLQKIIFDPSRIFPLFSIFGGKKQKLEQREKKPELIYQLGQIAVNREFSIRFSRFIDLSKPSRK
ncbi:hypothetical protein LWI29_016921 [Acer saccharum]|uniref:Uncharacterized protein n=1 Tax=Acer saccharum TaxID=4024 RepID=A0AA39RHN4_ACESA|nr:hypothetical protein LWI29_016921 [Acer saccharum]